MLSLQIYHSLEEEKKPLNLDSIFVTEESDSLKYLIFIFFLPKFLIFSLHKPNGEEYSTIILIIQAHECLPRQAVFSF